MNRPTTNDNRADLFPCPCCGSEEIELAYSAPPICGGPELWALECMNTKCGLVMPAKLSEREVSRAWNRREHLERAKKAMSSGDNRRESPAAECDCGGEPHGRACTAVLRGHAQFEDHAKANVYE